jgi:hypothetical protein
MMGRFLMICAALCVSAGCANLDKSADSPALPAPRASADRATANAAPAPVSTGQVYRISTGVPYPRGLHLMNGKLYVLARGRVRDAGGVDASIDDRAGTIFEVDPAIMEPASNDQVSQRVRDNARPFAEPTSPPFILLDRTKSPPTRDHETDRPYCSLRFDPSTHSFYVCAFSGIDKPEGAGSSFSKNTSDALLRFDLRTRKWYQVERHAFEAGGNYPQHDPYVARPPHGWLNGPDNCLAVGDWLYAVAKDNSVLVRYDLRPIRKNANAGPPDSFFVLGRQINLRGQGLRELDGHSMLAERDGYLYIGYRTSSEIVRIPLKKDGLPVEPIVGELIGRFDPYDPVTKRSANLTDMVFGPEGDLYVISAKPSRVFRFAPDPDHVFDGRTGHATAWLDLAALTNNPEMKSENVLVDDQGRVFITSGDAYGFQNGAGGTIYCVVPSRAGQDDVRRDAKRDATPAPLASR